MKKVIVLVISFIMIINLTGEVFAQSVNIKGSNQGHKYFPQTKQAGQEKDKLLQEIEKTRQAQENVSRYGITYEDFKKEITGYAKENKMNIKEADIQASWQNYVKQINRYERDYLTLAKLFNKKTYLEVITDSDYFLTKSEEQINYDGKKYDRASFLHAAVKNLATRHNTGYFDKDNQAKHMSEGQKIEAMAQIYEIVSREGFNPQDKELVYNFTYNIVANGKKYFDNDFFVKHNLIPAGLRSARNRQKNEQAKDARQIQASIVAQAMVLLPVLSNTSEKKAKSAKAIYEVASKIMRNNYGTIGIVSGAEALIALKTDDSLNKLYTLLSEDLYRSLGTEVALYVLDSFSIEEWAKRNAAFANGIKNGLGQYHNAIARRFLYIDPKKNSADKIRIASVADESLEAYYNVVYTDILEDIGKALGSYSKDAKVSALVNKLVSKYIKEVEALKARQNNLAQTDKNGYQTTIASKADVSGKGKGQTAYERESNLHTSLIVGILATTKQKSENLTKAAKIIYNGYWWDLTEATQRDKNNIAAKYLGAQKKGYNAQKQKQFTLLTKAKNVGRFTDIFVQAAMLGKLIVSIPNIVRAVNNFARRIVNGIKAQFKVQAAGLKPVAVEAAQARPAQAQPVQRPALKPAEPAKAPVVEPAKAPVVEPVKAAEPVKVAQPIKAGAQGAPQAAAADVWIGETSIAPVTQEQVAKVAQNVKGDILGKYYQRPAAMAVLPFGPFNNINKRITAFLTNRPYLSENGIVKVKAIIDEAASEVAEGILTNTIAVENMESAIKERVYAKIQESTEFTDAEKAELLKEQQSKAAEEALQTELERETKAAEEVLQTEITKQKAAEEAQIRAKQEAKAAEEKRQYILTKTSYGVKNDMLSNFHLEESLSPINQQIRAFVAKQPYIGEYELRDFYAILDDVCSSAYGGAFFDGKSVEEQLVLSKKLEAQILDELYDEIEDTEDFSVGTRGLLQHAIYEYVYSHPNPYYSEFWELPDDDLRPDYSYGFWEPPADNPRSVEISIDMNDDYYSFEEDRLKISIVPTKMLPARTPSIRVVRTFNLGKLKKMDEVKAVKLDAIINEAYLEVEQAIGNAASLGASLKNSIRGDVGNKMATLMIDLDEGTFEYVYKDQLIDKKIVDKIHQSPDFTAEEKKVLTGQTPDEYKAEKLYQESVSIWQKILPEQINSQSAEEALAKIQEAIKLNPKEAAYYEQLYLIQSWRDSKAALDAINMAIGSDPTNNIYYIHRGNLLAYSFDDKAAGIADMYTAILYSSYEGGANGISYCKVAIEEWGKEIGIKRTKKAISQIKQKDGITDIKRNMLGSKNSKLSVVPSLPINFLNISKKTPYKTELVSYLTGKTYLSEAKAEEIKSMVEAATEEVRQGLAEGTIEQSDMKKAIEEKLLDRIPQSSDFTAEEKDILVKDLQNKIKEQAIEKTRQAEIAKQKTELAEQKKIKMKQEQERREALTENQREAEDLIRITLKTNPFHIKKPQKIYDIFEEAISKEDRLAVKAEYLFQEANFLRYARHRAKGRVLNIGGEHISCKKAAMLSYDRAIEYAPNNTLKAKYLNGRADFKKSLGDRKGANADRKEARILLYGEDMDAVNKGISRSPAIDYEYELKILIIISFLLISLGIGLIWLENKNSDD